MTATAPATISASAAGGGAGTSGETGRAPRRSGRALTLGLASLGSFMVALDLLVVTTALDTIRHDLGASSSALQWSVTAYSLSFAVLLMTGAALGDRFGRRRMFATGLAVFVAGSAAAALSGTVGALIAARVVQGAGAALVLPLGLTIVSAAFPPERQGAAIGTLEGISGLAVIVGPLFGGAVVQHLAWEWVFWINVPIGLVAMARFLPAWPLREDWRLVPTTAGGQLAFGCYRWDQDEGRYVGHSIDVLRVDRHGHVVAVTAFLDAELLSRFRLPPVPS